MLMNSTNYEASRYVIFSIIRLFLFLTSQYLTQNSVLKTPSIYALPSMEERPSFIPLQNNYVT